MKFRKNKQKVGFKTMKMEDGLRCDPCSCFYLDKRDYLKHMTQFHKKKKITPDQKRNRKRGCTSCCQWCDCTGIHINKDLVKNNTFKKTEKKNLTVNIKTRWNKISKILKIDKNIKEEPQDSFNEALKVEVIIKTEDDLAIEGEEQIHT